MNSASTASISGEFSGLVLSPIFEADLQPEQYAYREGRSALDAGRHVQRLVNTGHREVVDGDLSNYCREIPYSELLQSVARRVSDGRLPGWIKLGLEMAVEEEDGEGGKRRTNRAPRSPRCSATSTCGGSFWGGNDWATPSDSERRS